MSYSWVSVEARNGGLIADLPLFDVPSVKQTIGRYESQTGTLPITRKDAPPDWLRATKKGAAHLILLGDNPNDPAHGIPLIGYMINRRTRTEADTISLDIATAEAYFDRRYVGDQSFVATGQNDIISALINGYILDGAGGKNGFPIRVQYVTPGSGTSRDRTDYLDVDDKTVYSLIQELSGVDGGPEWYVGWEWQHNPERLTPVIYIGDRIGNAVTPGMAPNATFDMPGCATAFSMVEDYGTGKGANDVMAVSSGEGNIRPQSSRETAVTDDMPTFEYRWTPSTSITDVDTLTSHAISTLGVLQNGTTSLAMSAAVSAAPPLGTDWFLGDDIGYQIGNPLIPGDLSVPAFPGGISGIARAASYELTLSDTPIITPVLLSSDGSLDG